MPTTDELFAGLDGLASLGFRLNLRRRASVDAALQALPASPAPKRKPASRGTAKAGIPVTAGRTSKIEGSTFDDEILRRRRSGGGGGGGAAPSRPVPSARPVDATKVALATGSQSAVVKLVSYAGGAKRAGALMRYQSREGELMLQREDGSQVAGLAEVQALASEWARESTDRQPSKDVLLYRVQLPATAAGTNIAGALRQAMPGHKFAWRAETSAIGVAVEVVATAASSQRSESGKAQRIYDNRKSLDGLEARLATAFGGIQTFDQRGFSHGVDGAARYLSRLTKGGQRGAFTSEGRELNGHEANLALAKSWKHSLRSREQRDVAHIVLSAKPGTDKAAFMEAAAAMLAREFPGHKFATALHEDRRHLHVHAVVKMQSEFGQRIHPRINDFKRWRQTLAEEARERNIDMEAASRFESANPPGYKLQDIRRVERGVASQAVRRRVEAVQTRAVHLPTREEGRQKARAVAGQWQALASRADAAEPTLATDMVRLYRAEGERASRDLLFTLDRGAAQMLAESRNRALSFLDVPRVRLPELTPSRSQPDKVFVIKAELARDRQILVAPAKNDIVSYIERSRIAAEAGEKEGQGPRSPEAAASSRATEVSEMPSSEAMELAAPEIRKRFDAIEASVPEDRREDVQAIRRTFDDNLKSAIDAKRAVEAKREASAIEGEGYVPPKPRNYTAFVTEQRGENIRYAHRLDDDGAGRTAFTDSGAKVTVEDWKDRESTLAALQLASEKWGAVKITGPERYKVMAVQLAAEHGFRISNPELQESLEKARAVLEAQQQSRPGFERGDVPKESVTPEQRQALAAVAYAEVSTHKTPAVEAFANLVREIRHGEDLPGHRFEKAEAATQLLALARRDAIGSVPEADRTRFAEATTRFIEANTGLSRQAIEEADKSQHQAVTQTGDGLVRTSPEAVALQERIGKVQDGFGAGGPTAAQRAELVDLNRQLSRLPIDAPQTNSHTGEAGASALQRQPSRIAGELVGQGRSPFGNAEKGEAIPYADIRGERATTRVWGVGIPSALGDAGARQGDKIELKVNGREIVAKDVVVVDPETKRERTETMQVTRNRWVAAVTEREVQKEGGTKPGGTSAEGPAAVNGLSDRSDTERAMALQAIRERTEAEATREFRQAKESTRTHERPIDGGGPDHAYRTEAEAGAAARAERAVEDSASRPMPADAAQSAEIASLRQQQGQVLREQAEADKQKQTQQYAQRPHRPKM